VDRLLIRNGANWKRTKIVANVIKKKKYVLSKTQRRRYLVVATVFQTEIFAMLCC